ncbi:MAG: hypothetical protein IT320_27175 [Anaerolineae bacterium]|nr:hypothetical protein [Anaerolineae bacterium]
MIIRRAMVFLAMFLAVGCTAPGPDFRNLTVEQLRDAGYYGYLLPEWAAEANDLSVRISMDSFDAQCSPDSGSDNPVRILYTDADGLSYVGISIAPYNTDWDNTGTVRETLAINAEWVPSRSGQLDLFVNGNPIVLVEDTFGHEVVFFTRLSLPELVAFIQSLSYAGPPVETWEDPWVANCES